MAAQEIIPSGIAKDATLQDIKALITAQNETNASIQALNETMLYFLNVLMAKQPRLDANQRAAVNVETGSVSVASITTLSNLTAMNGYAGGQSSANIAHNMADAGLVSIYDNIRIS